MTSPQGRQAQSRQAHTDGRHCLGLAAGKSAIHGWGAFTKAPAAAGDMLVEYMGELVRRPVADARERRIYDILVGAGTYVFGLSDELVVDATRKGSASYCSSSVHATLHRLETPYVPREFCNSSLPYNIFSRINDCSFGRTSCKWLSLVLRCNPRSQYEVSLQLGT